MTDKPKIRISSFVHSFQLRWAGVTETVESRCREFAKYLSEFEQQQAIHSLVKALISNSK